jgi:hypothetical protein
MLQRELSNARQVDIDPIDAHLHTGKASFRREALQVLFGRDVPRRARRISRSASALSGKNCSPC